MKSAKMIKHLFHPAAFVLALAALVSLLLIGCGDLNDNPYEGGITVQVNFDNVSQSASSDGGASPQDITFPDIPGTDPVLSVVLGAIVITHTTTPYNNANIATLTPEQRELLEADAEQSVQYLEIIKLPYPENTISFPIPPGNAGPWQLVAVGMRHSISSLGEIENNSPIWYGFIDEFLNDVAEPGQVLNETLTLVPACAIEFPPDDIGGGGVC